MTDPMTPERFQDLADAYGGTIARWPEAERAAALQFAAAPAAQAVLEQAVELDAILDAWATPAVSPQLTARIVADAPAFSTDLAGRARFWWSGLGFAATLAGAAAGSIAAAAALPAPIAVESATVFGSFDQDDLP